MRTRRPHRSIAVLATCSLLAGAGAAVAQDTPQPATTVTVTEAPALKAGMKSPFDVPGVRAIRAGKAIPSGYALVGRTVTVVRTSGPAAGAALRFTCPQGKRLRSFAATGGPVGFLAVYPNYPGKRSTVITTLSDRSATGSIYAVCR